MSTATVANTYCGTCLKDVCEHTLQALTALRAELAASEALVTALQEQMKQHAEQHARAVAEAQEETREACAQALLKSVHLRGLTFQTAAATIRATPLDATPLAARIAELDADVCTLKEATDRRFEEMRKAESALAAEVERHQATAKERAHVAKLLWRLMDVARCTCDGKGGECPYHAAHALLATKFVEWRDASLPARGGR